MAQSLASGALGGAAGFRVVPLSAADAPAYRALMLHAYESAADAFTSTPQERAAAPLSWWLERIAGAEGRSQVVGAFANQVLVGALTLECATQAKTRHKAHLAGMFVAPSARGQGVGRALMQAAMGFINIEQNRIIKIFSVVSVVFLPPTLVASSYGMNFEFMPELRWSFGYPGAISLMIIAGLAPYLYFKRKNWL